MFLIKEGKKHYRESCEENIVNLEDPFFIKYLAREGTIEAKPELRHYEQDIFVKSVRDQIGVATVGFATMHK